MLPSVNYFDPLYTTAVYSTSIPPTPQLYTNAAHCLHLVSTVYHLRQLYTTVTICTPLPSTLLLSNVTTNDHGTPLLPTYILATTCLQLPPTVHPCQPWYITVVNCTSLPNTVHHCHRLYTSVVYCAALLTIVQQCSPCYT